jgi:hypothetical protein
MTGFDRGSARFKPYEGDSLTEDERRELLDWARRRVPVLREIAAVNLAEVKRLQDEYARRAGKQSSWP